MPNDINSALIRLEENLAKVNSAREQVEQTVKSGQQVQDAISKYAASLNSYNEDVRNFVQLLQGKSVDMDDAIKRFKNEASGSLKLFADENAKLDERVNSLAVLKESLSKATADVTTIKESLKTLSEKFEGSTSSLNKEISATKTFADSLLKDTKNEYKPLWDSILSKEELIIDKCDTIVSSISDIKNSCDTIINSIDEKKKSLDEAFSAVKQNIDSASSIMESKINRNFWVMIVGLIAIIATIIVCH